MIRFDKNYFTNIFSTKIIQSFMISSQNPENQKTQKSRIIFCHSLVHMSFSVVSFVRQMLTYNDLMEFWFSASLEWNSRKSATAKSQCTRKTQRQIGCNFYCRSFMELMTYHINHHAERIKVVNVFGKSSEAFGHANRSLFTRAKRKKLLKHNRDLTAAEASY